MGPLVSDPSSSKRENQYERKFPELILEAGGWVLHGWAEIVRNSNTDINKRKTRTDKIQRLQRAIAKGIDVGNQRNIPWEIVDDELRFLSKTLPILAQKMGSGSRFEAAVQDLASATQPYGVLRMNRKEYALERTIWLGEEAELMDYVDRNCKKQSGDIVRDLSKTLAAQLFGYTRLGMQKMLTNNEQTARRMPPATPVQGYLVAMFLIGARTPTVDTGKLLTILNALKSTGYHYLALFHLARRASMFPPVPEAQFPWRKINLVCRALDTRAKK